MENRKNTNIQRMKNQKHKEITKMINIREKEQKDNEMEKKIKVKNKMEV